MKKLFPLLSLCGLAQFAEAQTLYNNGATVTIATGASVNVLGNFTNTAGSTLSNSGALTVSGNTINNGTVTAPAGSTLTFNGTAAQTVSGTQTVNVSNVVVNNAAGITLNAPLQVSGTATFTAGLVTAASSTAPLVFTATGTVSGTPTDASHVDGYVQKLGTGTFTYPVGNAAKYQPVGINLSANSAGVTARYIAGDAGTAPFGTGGSSPTPLQYYNNAEYWDITPAGTATGAVTIYFDGFNNMTNGSLANLRVAHKTGGQFLNEGASGTTGTTASGTVTSNSISTFSPFTVGSVAPNTPLPLKLLTFNASSAGQPNRISWETAEEEGGTRYGIERSADATAFAPIGEVAGAAKGSYTFYDDEPAQLSYYRLRISEMGQPASYSNTVAVRRNAATGSEIRIYPIPVTDMLYIEAGSVLSGSRATIVDVQGRVVREFILPLNGGVSTADWLPGVYTLRLADGTVQKIVKE